MAGFTMIEMLIALAIVAIILSIATGSYGKLIDDAEVQKTADNLKAAIAMARGESITHGGNVRFCGSSDGASCTTSFDNGWLSYYDQNVDAALSSTDTILAWQEVDFAGSAIVAKDVDNNDTADFGFNYRGYPFVPISLQVSGRGESISLQVYANGRVEIQ